MTVYFLNLFDLFTTLIVLRLGGVELNPFLQDVEVMVAYKAAILPLLLVWLNSRSEPIAVYGLKFCEAFYALVIAWNMCVIFIWFCSV